MNNPKIDVPIIVPSFWAPYIGPLNFRLSLQLDPTSKLQIFVCLILFFVVFFVRLDIMLICEKNVSRLQFFNNKFEGFKYASYLFISFWVRVLFRHIYLRHVVVTFYWLYSVSNYKKNIQFLIMHR